MLLLWLLLLRCHECRLWWAGGVGTGGYVGEEIVPVLQRRREGGRGWIGRMLGWRWGLLRLVVKMHLL